jgi:uncharacterized protein with GYD domain
MVTFIYLVDWTEEGVRQFVDSPKRARAFTQSVKALGGRVRSLHWTLGSHDLVTVVEAPDDETATAIALRVSALGNVRTETLRAFDQGEFAKIVKKAS